MVKLNETVTVFDPLLSTVRNTVENPAIDTWHEQTLIKQSLRDQLTSVIDGDDQHMDLSGGMTMAAKSVEIGVTIGNIKISHLRALVVDDGYHDILFGKDILEHVFSVGSTQTGETRVASALKDDISAVALELYPASSPVSLKNFETFIKCQRYLHNIALLAKGEINLPATDRLKNVVEEEENIPDDKRLKLTWVDNGSIWITVKSSSQSALTYMANLFDKGAAAKLEQEVSAAKGASAKAGIDEATRDATIEKVLAEEERLRVENIAKTYETWRDETLAQIDFVDEVIDRTEDPQAMKKLREMRDGYIREIAEQGIFPIVRNIPRSIPQDPDAILLPPPQDNT